MENDGIPLHLLQAGHVEAKVDCNLQYQTAAGASRVEP